MKKNLARLAREQSSCDLRTDLESDVHLWYKSYSLHIIVLRGGTIQHGRSDQLCFYSETVGPDWSGMRTSRSTYLHSKYVREVRMRKLRIDTRSSQYVLGGARTYLYLEVRVNRAGPISSIHTVKQ
jgi:hypothetical protein